MPWRKVKVGELLLLEKGHEMQQIIGVGRQRVGRTPPSTQVPQKASDNGNGLAVIIKQFKGFVMDIVPADMVDSHGSLAPFLTRKHLFLSRTNDLQSYTCPHKRETAFERRFQGFLRHAWKERSTKTIFTWPTNPILDPDATGRVTMDHQSRLVTSSLRRAYEQGATDVDATTLQEVADLMILRRDEITKIDALAPEQFPPEQEVG